MFANWTEYHNCFLFVHVWGWTWQVSSMKTKTSRFGLHDAMHLVCLSTERTSHQVQLSILQINRHDLDWRQTSIHETVDDKEECQIKVSFLYA